MQNENNSKSGSLIQLIRKQQLLVISGVVAGLLVGCSGGGGSSSSTPPVGTLSYEVSVLDDPIIGTTLTAVGCAKSTPLGAGKYKLEECTAKPTSITAKGGFIDVNGNGAKNGVIRPPMTF